MRNCFLAIENILVTKAANDKPQLKGILVARGITYIDSSGLSTLRMMIKWFQEKDIRFMVAGAIARDVLQSSLTELISRKICLQKQLMQ